MLVDSHCHLDRIDLAPYDGSMAAALAAARARGIDRFLCIGIDRHNAATVKQLAREHEGVFASVGVHPLDLEDSAIDVDTLCQLADASEVVAIGETGLDYYYSTETRELQQQSFRIHVEAARRLRRPLIVHTRNAVDDTLAIIAEAGPEKGVLHCFTESWDMARAALDLGFYISFSGIVTFRNAAALREVATRVPADRLLVETDSPYLAPVPFRGRKNEPKYVLEVAECIAALRGLSLEDVAAMTTANFNRLFGTT